jgi:hypothetical protein
MALQGSGEIRASQINAELGRSGSSNISLDSAENGSYVAINSCSSSKPNASNPASMSEWYSYNHSTACCNAPTITSTSVSSNSITVNFSTSNCTATHIEYSSNYGSSWSSTSGGCTSPRIIGGLASGTTYLIRMRITCTSTGGYSSYSSTTSATTGASYPAYGTYLSQYCTGSTLYYRYANGSGGSYDVSQGCSTTCGGCCCAPAYGTYQYDGCSGCDYYYYYADGCYGVYSSLVESNSANCGCGGGGGSCFESYGYEGDWEGVYCGDKRPSRGYSYYWGEYLGCFEYAFGVYGMYNNNEYCLGGGLIQIK